MLEEPPFRVCWACGTQNLGMLSVSGVMMTRRCRSCAHTAHEPLPALSKRTIYLDQFAVSQVFKMKQGRLAPDSNSFDFWRRAEQAIRRAYLLQQAVFPASHIHFKETVVWSSADELRVAHERLSGGVHFRRLDEIEMLQIVPFAQAYLRGAAPPSLDLRTDDVIAGERNAWIPRLHISVDLDFSSFAAAARVNRDRAGAELAALAETWRTQKPTFQEVFQRELAAFASAKIGSLQWSLERYGRAAASGDALEVFEAAKSPIVSEITQLAALFESLGVPADKSKDEVVRFWMWPGNELLPNSRLSAYLFAALARKMAAGQKRLNASSILSDFDAIAYFGPYVDAMLLDRECAGILKEIPKDPGHLLRAKVFSLADGDAFVDYLNDLADNAPKDVKRYAAEIHDIR